MALRIRLARFGTKHKPHYKIIVTEQRKGRNSNFIEQLGIYNPSFNPPLIKLERKRIDYWLKIGAKPTEAVINILKKEAVI